MSETIRIALLGVSHWHLPLYLPGLPEHSVVGISDDDLKIAVRIAQDQECPVYPDYRRMIQETRPDFVFAFAPHYKMKEVAEYLLLEGIPFSMEKPAGLNAQEVAYLYDLCEKKKGSVPFLLYGVTVIRSMI